MEKMKVLFLDLDGVLNDHKPQSNGFCGFTPECVDNLNIILNELPDLQIVISSSWRYMIPSSMTLQGFEYMLLVSGISCKGRVVGSTIRDESIPERADQIKHWLDNNNVEKHLALDDLNWDFPSRKIVSLQTNSHVGLTKEEAKSIIEYFKS